MCQGFQCLLLFRREVEERPPQAPHFRLANPFDAPPGGNDGGHDAQLLLTRAEELDFFAQNPCPQMFLCGENKPKCLFSTSPASKRASTMLFCRGVRCE
jgi:hypothetical protein